MIGLRLSGFAPSVYTRAVRLALHEKGLGYEFDEVDPFSPEGQETLRDLHPFGRVPVLDHYAFRVFETRAILGYLEDAFDAPPLLPKGAKARARVAQVVGIMDAYGYWPMVRQVFAHGVFRPRAGAPVDAKEVVAGLAASAPVLDALEDIAAAGLVLNGREITQADCVLAPMMDAFNQFAEGNAMLDKREGPAHWFDTVSKRPAFQEICVRQTPRPETLS
ncbi:MAG: glutathione S-transferase family protein [Pseudomonadota bacterium]